jgi:hypothetical protein
MRIIWSIREKDEKGGGGKGGGKRVREWRGGGRGTAGDGADMYIGRMHARLHVCIVLEVDQMMAGRRQVSSLLNHLSSH